MCREFSCVVSKDAKRIYIGSDFTEHSHSTICATHKLNCDDVFKFEIHPSNEASWNKSFASTNFTLYDDTIPPGVTKSKIAMARRQAWKIFEIYHANRKKLNSGLGSGHYIKSTKYGKQLYHNRFNGFYAISMNDIGGIDLWPKYMVFNATFKSKLCGSRDQGPVPIFRDQLDKRLESLRRQYPKECKLIRTFLQLDINSIKHDQTAFDYLV